MTLLFCVDYVYSGNWKMKSAFQGTAKSAYIRKEKSKNNAFAAKPKGLTNGPAKSGHVVLRGIAAEQSD